mmetsp:Transcript_19135/g.34872  ORF Transcript_19135/g.34872 Transcript_19135/m.34872 type:complete len:87 (+) Transcript_19135:1619-1879(+)
MADFSYRQMEIFYSPPPLILEHFRQAEVPFQTYPFNIRLKSLEICVRKDAFPSALALTLDPIIRFPLKCVAYSILSGRAPTQVLVT